MPEFIELSSGKRIKNHKERSWVFVLYPDTNDKHKKALDKIRASFDHLMIYHDKDLNDDGSPKLPHYHCIIQLKHQRYLSALSEQLGIEPNLMEKLESFDGSARYFLHLDNPEKFQYEFESFEGNLKSLAEKACIGKESESERILRILAILDDIDTVIDLRSFVRLICNAGLYADCRRAGYLMKSMLDEHNKEVQHCDI